MDYNAVNADILLNGIRNYTDGQIDILRNEAYQYLKSNVKDWNGCSLVFLGDHCGLYPAFAANEAIEIGDKRATRHYIVGMRYGKWMAKKV